MTEKIHLVCSYEICAGHRLYREDWSLEKNQKIYGKCANMHGHQYKLELVLEGFISDTGMIINSFDVDEIIRPFLNNNFDHKYLNDDVEFFKTHQPTVEWMAIWIFNELKSKFPKEAQLKKVRLHETHEVAAEYPVE